MRFGADVPLWVISGNSHREHMLSALTPKADFGEGEGGLRGRRPTDVGKFGAQR